MKVSIFDQYNENTKKLLQSLITAGITRKNLFVHYDGELPVGAMSPFTFFTNCHEKVERQDGLFFDQVAVPDWYDIRHSDGESASIEYLKKAVGKINYRKKGYRLVDTVDWFSQENSKVVVKKDRYNLAGHHYASTYFSTVGPYRTEYYDVDGRAVIIEDLTHRTIRLHRNSMIHHFENLTQFFLYFLKVAQIKVSESYINSLSFPLFISRALNMGNKTTLFWQENLGKDVPGNMKNELEKAEALNQIIFMKENQLIHVKKDFPTTKVKLNYLSNIGEFTRENHFRKSAFILTNSDNIHGLQDILQNLPELNITVAAYTNMSTKLLHMEEEFNNIKLIPSINEERLNVELEKADIYLDINHGIKVGDILKRAYQQQMIIFSNKEVAQQGENSLIFEDTREICNHLSYILSDRTNWQKLLTKMVEKNGQLSTIHEYKTILNLQ
ncbi:MULTISPECIES: hypothetical protein [Lactococcus]|uniref:GftB: Glycosyl transferase family 8 n=1 Tax=Lactococcus lactis subsp. cremoris TaxID=1359 RepID=A0A161W549_LACLC|nr:hypothetical protein [Lactococcus cremoris]KZK08517.1 GftB: Glycosyl transferase family 8 [Lactococcus cremoris]